MDAKKVVAQLIGLGAFIIVGLQAREKAIEGVDLVEEKVNKFLKRDEEPEDQK